MKKIILFFILSVISFTGCSTYRSNLEVLGVKQIDENTYSITLQYFINSMEGNSDSENIRIYKKNPHQLIYEEELYKYGQSDIVFYYEDDEYNPEKIITIEYWNYNDIELILE